LFTKEGMAEYLDFKKSHAVTTMITYGGALVGCVSGQMKGRAMYMRGGMVAPEWQGLLNAKKVFISLFLAYQSKFAKKVDYFYGELRTQSAKFQAILDELGWRPLALLPRKDVFFRKRESEVIYALYNTTPNVSSYILTKSAACIVSKILGRAVQFHKSPSNIANNTIELENPTVYCDFISQGLAYLTVELPGAKLVASICPESRNVENVIIATPDFHSYFALIYWLLEEMGIRGLEYAEIYVPSNAIEQQAALEALDFLPTGFVPHWYAPKVPQPRDCLIYTISFTSELLECPIILTSNGEFLRSFMTPPRSMTWELKTIFPNSMINVPY